MLVRTCVPLQKKRALLYNTDNYFLNLRSLEMSMKIRNNLCKISQFEKEIISILFLT